MVRGYLRKILRPIRARLTELPFAEVGDSPLTLALLSSCGVHRDDDTPFDLSRRGDPSFRRVAVGTDPARLTVTHGHYDESGVRADFELAFPVEAVQTLVAEGQVAALHPTLYSFRGFFHDVVDFMDVHAREVAEELREADVNGALITPC